MFAILTENLLCCLTFCQAAGQKNKKEREKIMEKLFKLKANGTTVRTEILAGLTTFMTMAYIITLLKVREKIVEAIPLGVRYGIAPRHRPDADERGPWLQRRHLL